MNRYTDEERRRILSWREKEGLTYPELSRRTGIPTSTLWAWASRYRKQARQTQQGFVPIPREGQLRPLPPLPWLWDPSPGASPAL